MLKSAFRKTKFNLHHGPSLFPLGKTTVYVGNLPKGVAKDEFQEMYSSRYVLKSYVRHDPAEANTFIMLIYLNENDATKTIETFQAAGKVFPGLIFDRGQQQSSTYIEGGEPS